MGKNFGFYGNDKEKEIKKFKRQCSKKSNKVYFELSKKNIDPGELPKYIADTYKLTKGE